MEIRGRTMADDLEHRLVDLIDIDRRLRTLLAAVQALDLPDCWIAAGAVRNRVWDHLHGHAEPTPPGDIDVVYFDPDVLDERVEKRHEAALAACLPDEPWSVKNQARMALVNGDPPYQGSAHALEHWCETPTPVGLRLSTAGRIEVIAPLGLDDLFAMITRPTPHAQSHSEKLRQYRERMIRKDWPRLWPKVKVLNL